MTALVAIMAAVLATAAAAPPRPALAPSPGPAPGNAHAGETRCDACHTAEGWDRVTFDHARTGFPLEGRHRSAACRSCHEGLDFRAGLPRSCAGCHRDVHAGRLGARCERCHSTETFAEARFGPESHRRTAFPLTGRHAAVACDACHGDRRDRAFARPTAECVACHAADRLRAGGAFPDHDGFGERCQGCHGTWRFTPASFPEHEACFPIRGGDHAGVRCRDCHAPVPAVPAGPLACASGTATCIRCHACGEVTGEHDDVGGFRCENGACYACHRRGVEEDDLRLPALRGGGAR